MKRLLLSLSLLAVPGPVAAQHMDRHAGSQGAPVQRRDDGEGRHDRGSRGAPPTTSQTTTVEAAADGFRLEYQSNADGGTYLRVLAPEGAPVQVFDGKKLIAEDDVPMSFPAKGERFYRVALKLPDGTTWEKKLAAKKGQTGSVWVAAPASQRSSRDDEMRGHRGDRDEAMDRGRRRDRDEEIDRARRGDRDDGVDRGHRRDRDDHSRAPPPAAPQPMGDPDFRVLKSAIEAESFGAQKLGVLETAGATAYFTVSQVGQLVDLFSFSQEKVRVVELTRARILDRQNAFQLYSHFDFSDDKDAVKRLLGP